MESLNIRRGPFSFFWLPAEIRRLVYQNLLYTPGDVILHETLSRISHEMVPPHEKTSAHTDILRTCWMVYSEAIGVLYGDNIFRWSSRYRCNFSKVMPMPTLLGGVKPYDIHKNVQLEINITRLGKACFDHDSFLLRLAGPTICRDVLEVSWDLNGLPGYPITERAETPSHLTNPIIQAIKQMSGFKKVTVRLSPRRTGIDRRVARSAQYMWSEALTRELESGLGPNLSKDDARLEFKPRNLPKHWVRERISPLLRLSEADRQRIIRLLIGLRPVFYPSTLPEDGNVSSCSQLSVLPQLKTVNSHLDLSISYTCRKLWEESWRTIVEYKHPVFYFDFAVPKVGFDSRDLNIRCLRNVHIKLKNLEKPSQLSDQPWCFGDFVTGLWYLARDMRCDDSLSRESLVIELDIANPCWHIRRERERGSGRLNNGSPWWLHNTKKEGDDNLGITRKSGLDLIIASLIVGLSIWNRIDIALSQRTLKNRYWRSSVTAMLEKYLGPNFSKDKRWLAFRPQYFARLCKMRNLGAKIGDLKWMQEFMRNRKHFSKHPYCDLAEAEDNQDGWTGAPSQEDDEDFAEPIVFSDTDSADGQEDDDEESDVDSDAISDGAEKAIAAVGELIWMEERGMLASWASSPISTDPETQDREDPDNDYDEFYDAPAIDPNDLDFGNDY